MTTKKPRKRLTILRTGDPKSLFRDNSTIKKEEITPDRIGYPRNLLSTSRKTEKGRRYGIATKVMYMTSGLFCPASSDGCRSSCLGHSGGRMGFQQSAFARDRRTALFIHEPQYFIHMLYKEIAEHSAEALCAGLVPAVRLNGSSDIAWEKKHPELFRMFPRVTFYDYTKLRGRALSFGARYAEGSKWPENYHLTYSASEDNSRWINYVLAAGVNVAVVFSDGIPSRWNGHKTIDGDKSDARFLDPHSDARFLDPHPVVVGLSAKGVAKSDLTGFVIRTDQADASSVLKQNVL